eukprot:COSAG02_NODE_816_length_16859_cov_15.645764_6_plen_121_part_00
MKGDCSFGKRLVGEDGRGGAHRDQAGPCLQHRGPPCGHGADHAGKQLCGIGRWESVGDGSARRTDLGALRPTAIVQGLGVLFLEEGGWGPAGRAEGGLLGGRTACRNAVGAQVTGFGWGL